VGADGVDRCYLIVSDQPRAGRRWSPALSDELGWPTFAKDTIKAALMSVLPVADVDDARRLGRAAVEVLLAVAAEVTGGAVLEAVWRRDQGRDEVSSLPGAVVEVFCRCDRPTLEARYAARRRSAGYVPEHQDPAELWSPETFEPLAGGWSVIEVDTAGEVDPVALADKVRQGEVAHKPRLRTGCPLSWRRPESARSLGPTASIGRRGARLVAWKRRVGGWTPAGCRKQRTEARDSVAESSQGSPTTFQSEEAK
jgi:hypothetical protein